MQGREKLGKRKKGRKIEKLINIACKEINTQKKNVCKWDEREIEFINIITLNSLKKKKDVLLKTYECVIKVP